MKQRKRMADRRIAQPGEPAGLVHPECCEVTACDFDEDQLAQSQSDSFAPNAADLGFHQREIDQAIQ